MSPEAPDCLLSYRSRFPILATTNYLISNSLGAVPAQVETALRDYYETWATRGVRAWEEGWWNLVSETGDLVAPILGARPGEIVFQPNVTIAHAVLFSGFDFTHRPRVVTDALHFPSILYLLNGLQSRGAEVVVVPSLDGISVDSEQVASAMDDRTAFVSVSHVLFKSAFVHDLQPIVERARRLGVWTIIDGYQAAGAIEVDVRRLEVDAYIGGCLKWLCGGPGNAFLWVHPERSTRLAPALTGWMAHQRPFGFEPILDRRMDNWRFLHGTPSIASHYAARPGLEIIGEIGMSAIRQKSLRQTGRLLERAQAEGFKIHAPTDPARRGGTIAVDVPHGLGVSRALKARNILCDYRPGAGIRLSPHFYTRDDELDEAMDSLVEILATGAWRSYVEQSSTVT